MQPWPDLPWRPRPAAPGPGGTVRCLLFDVFGTLVDWRRGIAGALAGFLEETGRRDLDPFVLADRWRARYQPAMEEVRSGRRDFVRLDVLHRENLEATLAEAGIDPRRIEDARLDALNLAWHRLVPWPDVPGGIGKLSSRYLVAPLSNGNISLLVDLARFGGLRFDAILGAEVTRRYKPDPRAYLDTVELLGLAPAEVMMVAAHETDLAAAAGCGLRTAYVDRPGEFGDPAAHRGPRQSWDHMADDLIMLADRLVALDG